MLASGNYWFIVEIASDEMLPCENHYRIEFAVSPQGCPAPEALSATGITASTADLGWFETGTASSWEYQVGPALFDPAETGVITALNPVTVSGLDANTSYDFYVRSVCGENSSPWTGPFTFTTACSGPVAMPWAESFEGTWPPACWTDNDESSYGWDQSIYGTERSGNEWAYCNKAGAVLESPEFTVINDAWLVFFYRAENEANPQDLTVKINGQTVYQLTGATSEEYSQVNIPLTAYIGQAIKVSFIGGTGQGGLDAGICIDDVSIRNAATWTGNLSTDWHNAANWSLSAVPGTEDIVTIPSATSGNRFPEISNTGNAGCFQIFIEQGASIIVKNGGNLTIINP
jgi:hypothetical protein